MTMEFPNFPLTSWNVLFIVVFSIIKFAASVYNGMVINRSQNWSISGDPSFLDKYQLVTSFQKFYRRGFSLAGICLDRTDPIIIHHLNKKTLSFFGFS